MFIEMEVFYNILVCEKGKLQNVTCRGSNFKK